MYVNGEIPMFKLSFDFVVADKLSKLFKNKKLPVKFTPPNGEFVLQAFNPKIQKIKKQYLYDSVLSELGHDKNTINKVKAEIDKSFSLMDGKVYRPKGDSSKFVKAKLSNIEDRRILNGVLDGHELDELKAIPIKNKAKDLLLFANHVNPGVILKEHNKITTLPDKNRQVKEIMQDLRLRSDRGLKEGRSLNELLPKFSYGDSPRLSRHAIKRMTELWKKDVV